MPFLDKGRGKVVAEFICAGIMDGGSCLLPKLSCLTIDELLKYSKGKSIYGWRIINLKIYDKPKELSEFKRYMGGNCAKCDMKGYNCGSYGSDDICYRPIKKAPQSWCYVDDYRHPF